MSLRDLLPPEVRVDERPWPGGSRAEERAAGRVCAAAALRALGVTASEIGVRADRSPDWPPGIVGSITHGAGEVAAAVAPAAALRGVGIDVEHRGPLPPGVLAVVADGTELAAVAGLGADGAAVVFSAKESVFKAWAPTRGWLEHPDVEVLVAPDGTFAATVRATAERLTGRWEIGGTTVRTCALHLP